MDKLYISKDALNLHNISLGEFLLLLGYNEEMFNSYSDIVKVTQSLKEKNLAFFINNKWQSTISGQDTVLNVILDSKKDVPEDKLEELAEALKEIFPKGKKPGTHNYWSEGKALIIKRLKIFFKKYGKVYDNDIIIDAAKRYVASFNGNYDYMRTLKYFIFKDIRGAEEIENSSDLINYIENAGEENTEQTDWSTQIV